MITYLVFHAIETVLLTETVALTKVWHIFEDLCSSLMAPWIFFNLQMDLHVSSQDKVEDKIFFGGTTKTLLFSTTTSSAERVSCCIQLFPRVSIVYFCCLILHDNKSINEPQLKNVLHNLFMWIHKIFKMKWPWSELCTVRKGLVLWLC